MRFPKIPALFLLTVLFATDLTNSPALAKDSSKKDEPTALYGIHAQRINGDEISLEAFKGKVLLISNIGIHCGTTPQLKDLQKLYEDLSGQGFEVLGFPSFDFAKSKGEVQEVKETCLKKHGITFPLFAPGKVIGPDKQPVFSFLTENGDKSMRGEVGFNFEKFLVDKHGKVRYRFGPFTGAQSSLLKTKAKELLAEGGRES
ncbi:MAG: glutathione peroxidase [Bdellovibrionales bacterium]|nr:glutathione peroxidase [Bdellovibrionales bacterium]